VYVDREAGISLKLTRQAIDLSIHIIGIHGTPDYQQSIFNGYAVVTHQPGRGLACLDTE
jgi:hypothetical protein